MSPHCSPYLGFQWSSGSEQPWLACVWGEPLQHKRRPSIYWLSCCRMLSHYNAPLQPGPAPSGHGSVTSVTHGLTHYQHCYSPSPPEQVLLCSRRHPPPHPTNQAHLSALMPPLSPGSAGQPVPPAAPSAASPLSTDAPTASRFCWAARATCTSLSRWPGTRTPMVVT